MSEPNGNARWQIIIGMATVAAILLAALWTLSWTAFSASARADDLAKRMQALETQNQQERVTLNGVCAHLVEIETQFRASDQVRNLMHANDLRIESLLWQRLYKEPYPADNPYLPTIAQDAVDVCR